MSLADKKSALFGKSVPASSSSAVAVSTSAAAPTTTTKPKPVTSSTTSSTSRGTGKPAAVQPKISQQAKEKKIEEAKELSERATKYLKTSVFQWSPDYLAAAPLYDQSAEAYKAAEQYDTARIMLVKSAECHEAYGSLASAAMSHVKAAKIASQVSSRNPPYSWLIR
jgi:hypothetical protein